MTDWRKKLVWGLVVVGALAMGAGGAALRLISEKLDTSASRLMLERPFGGKDVIYILLLGEDNTFSKDPSVRGRTDTILVAAVDLKNRRAQGISIPRDTRVRLPGRSSYEKINAAYVHGGAEASAQMVADLLRVPIHYYVKTNIEGLKNLVDLLGGVEIDIEKDMRYVDRRGGLYINLKKGYRHLDGDKALQYVRFRHDRLGDLSRIERQQKFLRALARRVTAPENWTKLPLSIDEILANVETNLSAREILALARLAKDIPEEAVKTATLPGSPANIGGISYYLPAEDEIPAVVAEILRFEAPKPTVAVLNGSGVAGSAERLAEVLRGAGYRVTKTGNARRFDYQRSVVLARDPDDVQTLAIAELLNCRPGRLEPDAKYPAEAGVVVIVGRDYY